jgi:hypothetical protein
VSRGRRGGSPTVVNLKFSRPEPLVFLSSSSSFILTKAEWTPFQAHCYTENVAAPEIEPGTPGSAARKSDQHLKYLTEQIINIKQVIPKTR